MEGGSFRDVRPGERSEAGVYGLVRDADKVQSVLEEIARVNEVGVGLLETVVYYEMKPADDRPWPKTWLGSVRVESFLDKLDSLYWDAFRVVSIQEVFDLVLVWNAFVEMSVGKVRRIFGNEQKFRRMYGRSRLLKDLFVVRYMMKAKGLSLVEMVKEVLKHISPVIISPNLVWKWNRYAPVNPASKQAVDMIEVGDE